MYLINCSLTFHVKNCRSSSFQELGGAFATPPRFLICGGWCTLFAYSHRFTVYCMWLCMLYIFWGKICIFSIERQCPWSKHLKTHSFLFFFFRGVPAVLFGREFENALTRRPVDFGTDQGVEGQTGVPHPPPAMSAGRGM